MPKLFAELMIALVWLATGAGQLFGQPPGHPPGGPPPRGAHPPGAEMPPSEQQPPMRLGPPGRWWNNPEMTKHLGMTGDQVKKMDEVFQAARFRLIDLNSTLRKEEAALEPLIQMDPPDDSKLLPQLDKVANARAELEKANARMLLGIRHVLTSEQWKKLQSDDMALHGDDRRQGKSKRK